MSKKGVENKSNEEGGAVGPQELAGDSRKRFTDDDGVERIQPRHQQESTARQRTKAEQRLFDRLQTANQVNLEQKETINQLTTALTRLCDDLVKAGNTPEQMRGYWSGYKPPEAR